MKKTFATILVTGAMMGMTFAASDSDKSFFGQIKSLFVKEVKETPAQVKIEAPQTQMKASLMMSASSSDESDDTATSTTATSTATTTDNFLCVEQKKLVNKKVKTEKSIKDQNEDKNKITKSLIKLEGSVDIKSAAKIKEKRLQLDKEVKDVTDIEVNIIDVASTTANIACDDDEKTIVAKNILKIKKLDTQVVDEADDVTNLIQKDIKILIQNIK